jgi:LysR family transcriptional regulator, low CO2-responsive transcriptional regulator
VAKDVESILIHQPVLVRQLRRLEQTIGVGLVTREKDSIHLTQEGRALFRTASKVFREIREEEVLYEEISSRKGADLRIGCPETLEGCLNEKFILDFQCLYPAIRITVNPGRDTTLAKSIEDGKNDLAVIRLRPRNSHIRMKPIGWEKLVLIAAPWSGHVSGETVHVRDLEGVPFVQQKEGSAVREVGLDYLRKFGVGSTTATEASSNALLKELVMRDVGVAFIERSLVEDELKEGLLKEVSIVEGTPVIGVAIGYPKRDHISPAAWAFLKSLKGQMTSDGKSADVPDSAFTLNLSSPPDLRLHGGSKSLGQGRPPVRTRSGFAG